MTTYTPEQVLGADAAKPQAGPAKHTYKPEEVLGKDFLTPQQADDGWLSKGWHAVQDSWRTGFLGDVADKTIAADKAAFQAGRMRTAISAGKTVIAGAAGLGEQAIAGIVGLANAATGGTFQEGKDATQAALEKASDFASKITHINMAASTDVDKAMNDFLGLLPQGIQAGGDTVHEAVLGDATNPYRKFAAAIAGAGTQALLTYLTLKPTIASKSFKAGGAESVKAFDELAAKHPESAQAMSDHMKEVDPNLAEYMKKRIDKFVNASEKDLQEIAERNMKAQMKYRETEEMANIKGKDVVPKKAAPKLLTYDPKVFVDKEGNASNAITFEQRGAAIRETYRQIYEDLSGKEPAVETYTPEKVELSLPEFGGTPKRFRTPERQYEPEDPIVFDVAGEKVTLRKLGQAFRQSGSFDPEVLMDAGEKIIKFVKGVRKEDTLKAAEGEKPGTVGDFLSGVQGGKMSSKMTEQMAKGLQGYLGENAGVPGAWSVEHMKANWKAQVSESKGYTNPWQVKFPWETKSFKTEWEAKKYAQQTQKSVDAEVKRTAADRKVKGIPDHQSPTEFYNNKRGGSGPRFPPNQRGMIDPGVFKEGGKKVLDAAGRLPAVAIAEGKLSGWSEQMIRVFNPEALGEEARKGAAIIAKNLAMEAQKTSSMTHGAKLRRTFWNTRLGEAQDFIDKFEKGGKFTDPIMQKVADAYRQWAEAIHRQDMKVGHDYEPIDNYMYHIFENPKELDAAFTRKFGMKWSDPKFIKDRKINLYSTARELGFKPKFQNPEDIMLARQHASDVAEMRATILKELAENGLAVKIKKGETSGPKNYSSTQWRSPTGERYWVHTNADAVLHNAFESKSLWSMDNIVGDTFRGVIGLKNKLIPLRLSFSLFHPIHVLHIDNAAAMGRVSELWLTGKASTFEWGTEVAKAATMYKSFWENPKAGGKLLRAWKGQLNQAEMTNEVRQNMQYMYEGGFIPEMSTQYRAKAVEAFTDALQRRSATALWHAPFAVLDAIQKPIFEHWIPSLKIASYMNDVKAALKMKPELMNDNMSRQLAFRKIAKSIDNRYGEMAYNTLFWTKWVKDLGVANTLSLGWNLGFIREYGGGALDLGQFAKGKGTIPQKIAAGQLHRPLFVTMYTTGALAYGGLMTYLLTGKPPQTLQDYTYPKTGDKNPDGSDARVSTMAYTREFGAMYYHARDEGVKDGLASLISSKSAGIVGLIRESFKGVNDFGQEIRDPDAPGYKQLEQTLKYALSENLPITATSQEKLPNKSMKNELLNVSGFSPAPKYVTDSATTAGIKATFQKYYAQRQTPFEKAEYSKDARKLRDLHKGEDQEAYQEKLDEMADTYGLTAGEKKRLDHNVKKGTDPLVKMFQRMDWQKQKKLLDKMTPEERETYLPKSNKEHLRSHYEEPVE